MKKLLFVLTIPITSVSYGSSPDVLKKEAIGLKGKVKKLIRERGFAFISAEDGREIFFHRSALEGTDFDALEEGNFNVERGPKGPRGVNVRMIEGYPKEV